MDFKINKVVFVIIFVMFSSISVSSAENDSFQQVMNYLVSGNPFNKQARDFFGEYEATIFDRKGCISGWKDNEGGTLKIYWNNVDLKSIKIRDKFFQGAWIKYISLSGHPFVAVAKPRISSLNIPQAIKRFLKGKYSRISIQLGKPEKYDDERLIKALQLLYSKHCTGAKRKSAF